jgi:hypothetical protein
MTLPLPEAVRIAEATLAELRDSVRLAPDQCVQTAMTMIFLMAKANGTPLDRMLAAFRQEWEIAERGTVFVANPKGLTQ